MSDTQKPRRVRALQKVYVGHVLRREGEEFVYDGPAAAHLFLELEQGDESPVTASVPRTTDAEEKVAEDVTDVL